jgi:UDP-N-acetylmuramyl tripeptide synthase
MFTVDGRAVCLLLMKNPGGAGPVISQVAEDPRVGAVVVSVNDDWADGRDVSWIWDADFESIALMGVPVVASGRRAAATAVRLKFAGCPPVAVQSHPRGAIGAAASRCPADQVVGVLATYTAMLQVRRALLRSRRRWVTDQAV